MHFLNPITLYNPPTNLCKLCIISAIPPMCKRGVYTILLNLTKKPRTRRLNPSGVHGSAIMIKLTHLRLNKLATDLQHHTRPSNPLQMRKHLARINTRTHLRDHSFYTDTRSLLQVKIYFQTRFSRSALGKRVYAYGIANGQSLCPCFWRIQIICGSLLFLAPVFHYTAEDAYIYV